MRDKFRKINKNLWEVQKEHFPFMRVPARLYATEKILNQTEDRALEQLINISSLPGIVRHGVAMPDIHSGYGPPIGGVGATLADRGVISPGFVGFDQNCGVRLLTSNKKLKDIDNHLENISDEIFKTVPSGVGQGRARSMSMSDIENVLDRGVEWLVEQGFGEKRDVELCEAEGNLVSDHEKVSKRAKKRGLDQVGTLGGGNHFIEIQVVDEIYDDEKAEIFELEKGQVVVMIHTGSRGLGHQNCKDFLKLAEKSTRKNKFNFPDKQLKSFPFNSQEGRNFFLALGGACNFSFSNRQMIAHLVRKVWKSTFSDHLSLLYDVAHNTAKLEDHEVDGEVKKLVVHRKGATRAFPPGAKELPDKYKETGQPVIMPGSMGTCSYVLAGSRDGKSSFYSTAHGAGRKMSRTAARKNISNKSLFEEMKRKNIILKSRSKEGATEEAPGAYKDINEIADVVSNAGLAKKVAKVKPLAVIKGE